MTPMDRALYPENWEQTGAVIRERAQGRCECMGECGLHPPIPTRLPDGSTTQIARRCREIHGTDARWARGRVILTVAHLDHDPANNDPENLRALCQRCHNRIDTEDRQKHAAETRRRKKGNGELFDVV